MSSLKMDNKLAKKFSSFMRKLPSYELMGLIKTKDQLWEWITARSVNKHIADCFYARFTGKNDPIEDWKNQGKLQHLKWEMVWQSVDILESLWGLIQLCFSDIEKLLEAAKIDNPFPIAFDLFLEVVKINENTAYSKCLKPQYKDVVTQNEQFFKLTRDNIWKKELKEEDQKKLNQISKNFRENLELLEFVWAVCLFKAKSSSLIAAKVEEFKTKTGLLCALITNVHSDSRKGRIPEGKLTSSTWIEGVRYQHRVHGLKGYVINAENSLTIP